MFVISLLKIRKFISDKANTDTKDVCPDPRNGLSPSPGCKAGISIFTKTPLKASLSLDFRANGCERRSEEHLKKPPEQAKRSGAPLRSDERM
jgi:hypothetical protein